MKKIIISENQLGKIKRFITEQHYNRSEMTFEQRCQVLFNHRGLSYKGNEIDGINMTEILVSYKIELGFRRYGITNLNIYDIHGPDYVQLLFVYYDKNDDEIDGDIIIDLNWNNTNFVKTTPDAPIEWFGIDSDIEIDLQNDENGNIIATRAIIPVRGI